MLTTTNTNTIDAVIERMESLTNDQLEDFNISLLSGLSGTALVYQYLGKYKDPSFNNKAELLWKEIEQRIVNCTFNLKSFHSYCSGLGGVLFAAQHAERYFANESVALQSSSTHAVTSSTFTAINTSAPAFDDLLFKGISNDFERQNTDFLHGPLGLFYYYLQDYPSARSNAVLDQVFDQYLEQLITDEKGSRIYNSVILDQQEKEYNFGLAHGMSGHLMIWSEAFSRGWRQRELEPMIRRGLQYIDRLKKLPGKENPFTYFPSYYVEDAVFWATEEKEAFDTRLGWCYGDLNIALMKIKVGKCLDDDAIYQEGIELARATTKRRTHEETKIKVDPYVCHGSSGLALIYQAIHQENGHPDFQDAQTFWLEKTDKLLNDYLAEDPKILSSLSLLDGLPGIALALLAKDHPEALTVNELFLLNL